VNITYRILVQNFTDNGNDNDKAINEDATSNTPFHFTASVNQEGGGNNNLDSVGRRKQVEYLKDPKSGFTVRLFSVSAPPGNKVVLLIFRIGSFSSICTIRRNDAKHMR
jgi:hypothetical protein